MNPVRIPRVVVWFAGIASSCLSASAAQAQPSWYSAVDQLTRLFQFKTALEGMGPLLEYFRVVFTLLGCGAVMISAIRRVAKSRTGEESMGWVASTMMTIGLMATGPWIGARVFEVCDDVATASEYSNAAAIKTCWDSLLVILPGESPSQEVLQEAKPTSPPKGPTQKEDASWTKLAWTWMKMAWTEMSDAFDKIGVAVKAVVVRFIVLLLLFVPAVSLITGMILVQVGGFVREFLHQTMDVFLPMMIGMLSFGPMRGAATNFIVKYISVAFWPIAWALGNAVACSLLLSVMKWVVANCQHVIEVANKAASDPAVEIGPATAGYLVGAAVLMPWGYLFIIVLVVTLTSTLIHISAVGAPAALTSLMTKGTTFAGAQLKQAAAAAGTVVSGVATGGASLAVAPAAGGALMSLAGRGMASLATRASSSLGSAAARLGPAAASGGPAGMLASAGARVLGRAAGAMASFGGEESGSMSRGETMTSLCPLPTASNSMRESGVPSRASAELGSPSSVSGPMALPAAKPLSRSYRRNPAAIDI